MENKNSNKQLYQVWDNIWTQRRKIPYPIIYLKNSSYNRLIVNIFEKEIGDLTGKKIIEVGCGTGTTSIWLSKLGANISLLDISLNSIKLSKSLFQHKKRKASSFNASMFELPLKEKQYDVVWNTGVLEHFERNDQKRALLEMKRICKPGGVIITINPSEKSLIYKRAKEYALKKGRWQAGNEIPVKSFKDLFNEVDLIYDNEYFTGFLTQFQYLKYYFPSKILRLLFFGVWEVITNIFYFLDRYEGHFLVSIAKCKNK